jgi:molecular chaperone HtpG
MNIEGAALMAYLKASHGFYHGKALELREVIEGWLSYVPHSFPHYTRHTVRHSDEIIIEMSRLLFLDDSPISPTISLSGVEAYSLIAAAYLHDAGMVASDREKGEILKSDEWRSWTLEGGGAARWREIEAFRRGVQPANEGLRNFLADVTSREFLYHLPC